MIQEVLDLMHISGAAVFDIDFFTISSKEVEILIGNFNADLAAASTQNNRSYDVIDLDDPDTGAFSNDDCEAVYKLYGYSLLSSTGGLLTLSYNSDNLRKFTQADTNTIAFLAYIAVEKKLSMKLLYIEEFEVKSLAFDKGIVISSAVMVTSDGFGISMKIGDWIRNEPGLSAAIKANGPAYLAKYLVQQVDNDMLSGNDFKTLAAQAQVILMPYNINDPDFDRVCKFSGL